MRVAIAVMVLALASCGKVPDQSRVPDSGPSPGATKLDDGRLVTATVDDGFEQAAWQCVGTTCVQGSIKP